jgi:Outer membrane cytochrome MtrC/MtrF-like, domains II/IV/Cytochrome c554 and c-prime/Cytochrome c552
MKFGTSLSARVLAAVVLAVCAQVTLAQQCDTCHSTEVNQWAASRHADTQTDVAGELSDAWSGLEPNDVIHGPDAEDCIDCHAPTAVLTNGGMSEVQALGYFFTTSNGKFDASTSAANTSAWPQVGCTTCHFVRANHPTAVPGGLVSFNSQTAQYAHMAGTNQLCGQCHGSLRFANTDHRLYDAWAASKHGNTQADVASELSEEHVGDTPYDLIYGPNAENCIACHAPTAVTITGGDEVTALDYFFTTTDWSFTTETTSAHKDEWPSVGCTACHNPHNPGALSYFNSSTLEYETMTSSDELCGQCHGNLRFADTDHLSYNIRIGTGGVGVPDQQLMPDVSCTDCHMHPSDVDGSNSVMSGGHSWAVTVPEANGGSTISCLLCHTNSDAATISSMIDGWKAEFQALDTLASANVAKAAAALQGVEDPTLQAALAEAQENLIYAESDESGGVHNHPYLMALLQDANQKALSIPVAEH